MTLMPVSDPRGSTMLVEVTRRLVGDGVRVSSEVADELALVSRREDVVGGVADEKTEAVQETIGVDREL
jgi:hypothetical protein